MNIHYRVHLTDSEREQLLATTSKGVGGARRFKRAQILLASDRGTSSAEISKHFSVSSSTIYRTRRRFVEDSLQDALEERDRPGRPRKLDALQEACLVATTCSAPPQGQSRWTLHLLAERLVVLTDIEQVSRQTIMRRLKENELKPWQKKMWCIPKFDSKFVARMEHILDLYAKPHNPKHPVVNFDEAGKQLVAEKRSPWPERPGSPEKVDYEYRRVGMANIFLFFERHRGWRHAKVTQRKAAQDFAQCMRELVDEHYPHASIIHVVLDNLSTHTEASLYTAFEPAEALRISKRLHFHYTPVHASWLNMVEIEIGVMNKQCLNRRIESFADLKKQLNAWQQRRNSNKNSIKWLFDVDQARNKMEKAYPIRS